MPSPCFPLCHGHLCLPPLIGNTTSCSTTGCGNQHSSLILLFSPESPDPRLPNHYANKKEIKPTRTHLTRAVPRCAPRQVPSSGSNSPLQPSPCTPEGARGGTRGGADGSRSSTELSLEELNESGGERASPGGNPVSSAGASRFACVTFSAPPLE